MNTNKQTQEKKSTLRSASLRGVEFFPMGKEERGGAAQGGFLLLLLFIMIKRIPLEPSTSTIMSSTWDQMRGLSNLTLKLK